ncbi:CoA transferase [Nocardia sp. NPDC059228]|uniref:CoA transferase n=1 Tax=Nocardia sp. NPDC059228 TaxID=3346777 RepID=UPI00367D06C1
MHDILDGVRVVSLAVNLPGPLAAARLASFGATVTKVEPPMGDPLAAVVPDWYSELTGKQHVTVLDLKDSGDRAKLEDELAGADLLLTAMRPSALRRLGLDNAHEKFAGLSHIEIVGHDGDLEERPGHDLTYQAAYGTLQPPLMPTVPVVDLLGAERAVSAALLALRNKSNSTAGRRYRVVLEDAAADAGAAVRYGLSGPGDPLGGAIPTYGIYATADGYIALGAVEPHFSARTLEALGVADTHEDLARVFAEENTSHWEELAERVDIPIAGIRTPERGVVK